MDDQAETKTKLPPMTLSVVVPALPAYRQDGANWAIKIRIASIVVLVVSVLVFLLVPDVEIRGMLLMLASLTLFGLSIGATLQVKNLIQERDDYERRLQEMAYSLCEKNSNLKQLVQIDPLTQLLNRRGLEKALTVEVNRAQRKSTRLFAVLLDCDDFKAVNENYGHAGGDAVLQNMAANVFRSIRPTDYAARIGGDEFIVLLIDINEADAERVAERMRNNISCNAAVYNGKAVPCTASLGVAELPLTVTSIEDVLTLTRLALKESKTSGKNALTITGSHKFNLS